MSRLIIVSNRGAPISEGGPAVGVYDALKEIGVMWFGWSGDVVREPPEGITLEERRPGDIRDHWPRAVRLRPEYYRGFSNAPLWPAFHYRPDLIQFDRDEFDGYCRVNRLAREATGAAAESRRCYLGPRLSPDPVHPGAAR